MFESGYYPPGAEFDPRAPWNETEPDEVEMGIDYSCTMRRTATVETTNYVPGTWEKDEDGFGYRDGDDFSDTDWLGEYKEQYRTPLQLIELLRETAKELAEGNIPEKRASFWRSVIEECEGWELEDEETEML